LVAAVALLKTGENSFVRVSRSGRVVLVYIRI